MSLTGFSIIYYLFLLFPFLSAKDEVESETTNPYTQGYFIFPLSPGVTTSLSGSFGDLRFNHFHAGLDIRTGGQEGKSIYAAAEGYVSRINVATGGYGNALYITHPNGLTTVYGHLKEFSEPIKKILLAEQYRLEEFSVNLVLEPSTLPVKKGELVAFSGNTGGSGGPHLHFEIRDAEENTIDPALFGFKEIKDNTAPVVELVSLKCLSADARINGVFGTFDFPVSRNSAGQYYINRNIKVWGDIGLEFYTYDKAETSPFRLGIKYLEVKKDGIPEYEFVLDKLAFHNKIDMNLHTNYQRMVESNEKLHKGYFEEGNELGFYKYNDKKGLLSFRDNKNHEIKVTLKDTYENVRYIDFSLISDELEDKTIPSVLKYNEPNETTVLGSFLKIVRKKSDKGFRLVDGNYAKEISASYGNDIEETFIIDLKESYFTNFMDGDQVYPSPVTVEVSKRFNKITDKDFEIDFKNALYHPLFINLKANERELKLDRDIHPIRSRFETKWKVKSTNIDPEKDKVYLTSGRHPKYVGGEWQKETVSFHPKEFGEYGILRDVVKPVITAKTVNSSKLLFYINDALSGIKSFECRVNGKWVLMEYEYKNGTIWSEKLINEPFSGEVELKVTDQCGNQNIYKTTI